MKQFKKVAFFGMSKRRNFLGRVVLVSAFALYEIILLYKTLSSMYSKGIMDPFQVNHQLYSNGTAITLLHLLTLSLYLIAIASIKWSIDDPYMMPINVCWVELPTIQSIDKFITDFVYYDFKPDEIDQSNYSMGQKTFIVSAKWVLKAVEVFGVLFVFTRFLKNRDKDGQIIR